MTRRSVAAWIVGLGLLLSVPGRAQAQPPDLSTLMRSQILDIWLSRTPDGQRILIDPPSGDLRALSPFTLVTQIEQQIGSTIRVERPTTLRMVRNGDGSWTIAERR